MLSFIKSTPLATQWSHIGIKNHHGIAISLGSIVSKNSCGIGEYLDLIPLINWCSELGLDVIQLLPLNDSGDDPSPYNALSSRALHPIYLQLYALPFLQDHPNLLSALDNFKPLNSTIRIEYHEVLQRKNQWLKDYYELEKERLLSSNTYQKFYETNPWVQGYALYKTLKNSMTFGTWEDWPESLRHPTDESYQELLYLHKDQIAYYCILQYLCHEQLKSVKYHATKHHVFLKGDIPILISPDSADVWLDRSLFNMDFAVGYPPDVFNEEGQLWGFPAFKWNMIEHNHYNWWKNRLEISSYYYHLYRLDHIVGFYKLWLIPKGKKPVDGFYEPADIRESLHAGHKYLSQIVPSSSMLPIGEDLGNLPQEVFNSLYSLGIPGTRVIRWETRNNQFISMDKYSPLSMTCVSTHDSETLTLWWERYPLEAKQYCEFRGWDYAKALSKKYRYGILQDAHSSSSLFHINLFQEYLALFPELVHDDPELERINRPGFVLPSNWTYRFRCDLDTILSHEELKKAFRGLISKADPYLCF